MNGKYPLTQARLHQALFELLQHPEVTIVYQHMIAQQGLSNWYDVHPPTNILIKVDANQQTGNVDHIGTVVHELIHVMLMPMFLGWFTEDMEEHGILAYDAVMIAYIRKSPKRLHQWTEAINMKLQQSEAV